MANSGVVLEVGDDQVAAKVMELTGELKTLVNVIAVDDWNGVNLETLDRADRIICALKDCKMKGSFSLQLLESAPVTVPKDFVCPLSKELMRDPVVVASGQTYDRYYIHKWITAGNRTCPQTEQELSNVLLTPNVLLRRMISQWCKNCGIQLPHPIPCSDAENLEEADRRLLTTLLLKMSCSLPDQKESARLLRRLTTKSPSFRAVFGEIAYAIPRLIFPLSQNNPQGGIHHDLQEDVVTTLLNLSVDNKKLVAETPMVIPLLMDALISGKKKTKSNAAAALFTLSDLDSNKSLIGRSGALNPLIDLLDEGQQLVLKDVASAIFNLCIVHENKARAVQDGIVQVILKKIRNRVLVDELVPILELLSNNQMGVEAMVVSEAGPCLFSILRDAYGAPTKEDCIAILCTICFIDRNLRQQMREEEKIHGTISQLAQNGTSRAKRKASGILERLNRG